MTTWRTIENPTTRLEIARIVLPLAILGFFSNRLIHADHWLGTTGFSVPDLGGHWAQPFYLAPVSDPLAWALAATITLTALGTAVGVRARMMALVCSICLAYVAFADRLAAFTVTKLSPVIMAAIAVAPVGRRLRLPVDWGASPDPAEEHDPPGAMRFLQVLPVVIYSASGICKARGDWLEHSAVIWTHVHGSYHSIVTYLIASATPPSGWALMQWSVLIFEVGAPLWLFWRRTRTAAVVFAIGMHLMIGLMFPPVIWFSLLMSTLVVVGFVPSDLFSRVGISSVRRRFAAWRSKSTSRSEHED